MITLGARVTDSITGFSGTVVSRTTYLNGCVRVCVESAELKDGKPVDAYFDEQRLDPMSEATTGGSGNVPPARDCPSR